MDGRRLLGPLSGKAGATVLLVAAIAGSSVGAVSSVGLLGILPGAEAWAGVSANGLTQGNADLEEAIRAYRAGDVEAARQKFEEILAENPSNEEALSLYEEASERIWMRMLTDRDQALQNIAKRFSELARRGRKAKVADSDKVRSLSDAALSGNYGERRDAVLALRADHGSYSVAGLWRALGDENREKRINAILALNELGSDSVMPLIAVVLGTDDSRIKANAVSSLGAIGDARATPVLAEALNDADSQVQAQAQSALDGMSSYQGQSASELWVEFAEGLLVPGSMSYGPFDGVFSIWTMEDGNLTGTEVEPSLYSLKLAEQASFAAIDSNSANANGLRSLAITNACLAAEASLKEDAEGSSAARVALASCGDDALRNALEFLLERNAQPAGATIIAEELGRMRTPHFDALEMGLESSNKSIRYASAFSMAHCGSQSSEVIRIIGQAASEKALRQALVIDSDMNNQKALGAALTNEGYNVISAGSGPEGFIRAKALPPKDVIIASTEIKGVTIDAIVRGLANDDRTSSVPVILITPEGEGERYTELYGSSVAAVIDLADGASAVTAAVAEAVGDLDGARKAALAISSKAANMLANLDASQLTVAGSFLSAVVSDSTRPAEVRIPALRAMAKLQNTSVIGPVAAVFGDSNASPEIRAAAADCLAGIFSNASLQDSPGEAVVASLMNALESDDASVKEAASRALGAARFLSADQRATLLKGQR